MGTVITYGDMSRIYESIYSTNGFEDRRSLNVETVNGQIITLCSISTKGKADNELNQVIQ